MTTVYVVIGCDTDPDREGLLDGVPPGVLTWRGMTEGIPALKSAVHDLHDAAGHEPVFTWLLRADEQVRAVHGAYAAVVRDNESLLRSLVASGDELGWHPHFWRRSSPGDAWFQEVEDVRWQVEMLRSAHAELVTALPAGVRSVRMGWDYHNNDTYRTLEELGITVDFSALPGMRTYTGAPPVRGENLFDWHSTPRAPYRPSRADYRRAPRGNESASTLLEVPNFVSTSRLWGLLGGLQLARKSGDPALLWQAIRRPTYWINITARTGLFAPLLSELRATLRRSRGERLVFATYFHPDELLPNRSRMYDLANVRTNLQAIMRECGEAAARVEFVQASALTVLCAEDAQRAATFA